MAFLTHKNAKRHFRISYICQHGKSPYIIIIIFSWRFSLLFLFKIWMMSCLSNNFQRLLRKSVEKKKKKKKRLCPYMWYIWNDKLRDFLFQIRRMIKQRRKFPNFGREIFPKNGQNIGSFFRNREISHVCLCHARTVHPYKWRTL